MSPYLLRVNDLIIGSIMKKMKFRKKQASQPWDRHTDHVSEVISEAEREFTMVHYQIFDIFNLFNKLTPPFLLLYFSD